MKHPSLFKKNIYNTPKNKIFPYSIKKFNTRNTLYKLHRNKSSFNSTNIKFNSNKNTNDIIKSKILKFNSLDSVKNKNSNNEHFQDINLYESAILKKLKSAIGTNSKLHKNNSANNILNDLKNYERKFFSSSFQFNTKVDYNKFKYFSNTPRPISSILQRNKHGNMPIFINMPITYIKNYKNLSEKERDEKNILELSRLKNFLEIYWKQRKNIITEFFDKNSINNKEYYNDDNLENFSNFIYDNVSNYITNCSNYIDTRKTMKEIIDQGIKYKNYSSKKLQNLKKRNEFLKKCEENLEKRDSIKTKNEKIKKYRNYLSKNYKSNINYYFFSGKNRGELSKYKSKEIGTIDIRDENNIANNIEKQSNFSKLKSTSFFVRKNKSIYDFNEKDYNELSEEIKDIKNNYIEYDNKKIENENK